jgi:lysozyme
MSNDLVVLDISHYQPEPDWAALKAAGIVGIIMKATEGQTYVDETFARRYGAAIDAGLAVSSYHFLRPGSIAAQISHYLKTVDPEPGERVCLDHEDPGVSLADLASAVEAINAADPSLQVTIYSGHIIKQQLGDGYDDVLATTSLWIAQYTLNAAPDWPSGTWPVWSLWQYTDKAEVPGIEGNVDGNRFNGSAEQCLAWFGPSQGVVPEPESWPETQVVTMRLDVPDNVEVRVVINDERVV